MNTPTTTYTMALHTAMQATLNYSGITPCLTTFAEALCTQANTYSLSAGENAQLIKSVCDELAALLHEGLK